MLILMSLFMLFTTLIHINSTSTVLRKFVHENGLKEFVIAKMIKRNNCSCSCNCIPNGISLDVGLPQAPSIPQEFLSKASPKQHFKIVKEIRKNKCSCSCICAPAATTKAAENTHSSTVTEKSSTVATTVALTEKSTSNLSTTISLNGNKVEENQDATNDDIDNLLSTTKLMEEILISTPLSEHPSNPPLSTSPIQTTTESSGDTVTTSTTKTFITTSTRPTNDEIKQSEFGSSPLTVPPTFVPKETDSHSSKNPTTSTTNSQSTSTSNIISTKAKYITGESVTSTSSTDHNTYIWTTIRPLTSQMHLTTSPINGSSSTLINISEGELSTESTVSKSGPMTLSPQFKAKVANLLNRLKEQLLKLQQSASTTPLPSISEFNNIAEDTFTKTTWSAPAEGIEVEEELTSVPQSTQWSKASEITNSANEFAKAKQMLHNLKEKIEQLKAQANNDEMAESISMLEEIENDHFSASSTLTPITSTVPSSSTPVPISSTVSSSSTPAPISSTVPFSSTSASAPITYSEPLTSTSVPVTSEEITSTYIITTIPTQTSVGATFSTIYPEILFLSSASTVGPSSSTVGSSSSTVSPSASTTGSSTSTVGASSATAVLSASTVSLSAPTAGPSSSTVGHVISVSTPKTELISSMSTEQSVQHIETTSVSTTIGGNWKDKDTTTESIKPTTSKITSTSSSTTTVEIETESTVKYDSTTFTATTSLEVTTASTATSSTESRQVSSSTETISSIGTSSPINSSTNTPNSVTPAVLPTINVSAEKMLEAFKNSKPLTTTFGTTTVIASTTSSDFSSTSSKETNIVEDEDTFTESFMNDGHNDENEFEIHNDLTTESSSTSTSVENTETISNTYTTQEVTFTLPSGSSSLSTTSTTTADESEESEEVTLVRSKTVTSTPQPIKQMESEEGPAFAFVTEPAEESTISITSSAPVESSSSQFSWTLSTTQAEPTNPTPTKITTDTTTTTNDEMNVIRLRLKPMNNNVREFSRSTTVHIDVEKVEENPRKSISETSTVLPTSSTVNIQHERNLPINNAESGNDDSQRKTKILLQPSNVKMNVEEPSIRKETSVFTTRATTLTAQRVPVEDHNLETLESNLATRLEQARQLREEQRQLEMLNSIRRESTADSDTALENQQRRKAIEAKLAQLAQTERWHRELIQRYQLRQRAMANAIGGNRGNNVNQVDEQILLRKETTAFTGSNTLSTATVTTTESNPDEGNENDIQPKKVKISCEPVRRFIATFKVHDPVQWLKENCVIVKQFHPTASCTQIQHLLSGCFQN